MSLLGITKGTELENTINQLWKGEEQGAATYHALAHIAEEKGLKDMAEVLKSVANDEARHAGLYGVLNGHVNVDIFTMLSRMSEQETAAAEKIKVIAQQVRELGLDKAANEIEIAAIDEIRHGEVLKELVKEYFEK